MFSISRAAVCDTTSVHRVANNAEPFPHTCDLLIFSAEDRHVIANLRKQLLDEIGRISNLTSTELLLSMAKLYFHGLHYLLTGCSDALKIKTRGESDTKTLQTTSKTANPNAHGIHLEPIFGSTEQWEMGDVAR